MSRNFQSYHVAKRAMQSYIPCYCDFLFILFPVGPELPHTFNNKEWEEATREKLIRTRANPIQGISSKHPLPAAK